MDENDNTKEFSRISDQPMTQLGPTGPSTSFLDFLVKNQDFSKVSIKSL